MEAKTGNRVVGVGGANIDIHMKIKGPYVLRDSNPGRLFASAGGVTRNILENLAKLGVDCSLLTAVGDDIFRNIIMRSCEDAGISTEMFYLSNAGSTSSYLDLIDGSGDMFVGACDADVLENMPLSHLDRCRSYIKEADAVVCDTNLTTSQLEKLIELSGDVPLFIDPVSTGKAVRMKGISGSFYLIKPNRIELEALTGMDCSGDKDIEKACELLLCKGTKVMVVSLGTEGCYYADQKGRCFFKKPKKVEEMVNASGAGDAFMAGLVYSYLKKFDPEKMTDTALLCGGIAVMSEETINPEMSEELIYPQI